MVFVSGIAAAGSIDTVTSAWPMAVARAAPSAWLITKVGMVMGSLLPKLNDGGSPGALL